MNHVNQLQSGLNKKVRTSARSGNLMDAIITDVHYDRVSVSLCNDGALMRGLYLVGGPVEAGDPVQVDLFANPPYVIAKGTKYISQSDLDAALKKLDGSSTGSGDTITIQIMLYSGGVAAKSYLPSYDGFTEALTDAVSGDVVWLPDVRVSGDFVIPDGVTIKGVSSRESIVFGHITLGENSALENLKVIATSDENDVSTIEITATLKQAIIRNCEIHAYQCEVGNASTITMDGALLHISHSIIVAYADGGTGHAFSLSNGAVADLNHSEIWATTAWYTGTGSVSVHSLTEGFEESKFWCSPSGTKWFPNVNTSYGTNLGPIPSEVKSGKTLLTAMGTDIRTSGGSPGIVSKFSRCGNYIYCNIYVAANQSWFREFNITTGEIIDLQLPVSTFSVSSTFLAVVEERKIVACSFSSGYWKVFLLNFETSSNSVLYQIENELGADLEGGGQGGGFIAYFPYWYRKIYSDPIPFVIQQDNGDIYIVCIGKFQYWENYGIEVKYPDQQPDKVHTYAYELRFGRFIAAYNWTNPGSGWVIRGRDSGRWQAINEQADFPGMSIVGNKLICFIDDFVTSYGSPPNIISERIAFENFHFFRFYDSTDETVAFPYTPGWAVEDYITDYANTDILTFHLDQVFNMGGEFATISSVASLKTGIWGNGLAPYTIAPGNFGTYDKYLFLLTVPTNSETDFIERIWKADVLHGTSIELYHTAIDDEHFSIIVSNASRTFFMQSSDGEDWTVVDAETLAVINTNLTDSHSVLSNIKDLVMDDTRGFVWGVDKTTNEIIGINPETGEESRFPYSGLTGFPSTVSLYCLGNVFIIIGYNGSGYSWKLIKETP